ncbi:hypothetical protein LA080_004075 [Diaporthe eres]|nr:hypothetical protein LA080_004075 [Diaporthe eres]
MPSPRRPKSSVDYFDGHNSSEDDSSHRRSTRPRGYGPKLQRGISETSLMRQERKAENIDNDSQVEWDTDYDPRDKYYLSAEDDPLDSHVPERKETARNQDPDENDHDNKHKSSEPPSKPSSHASRPRPRPSRASSSYLSAVRRPQVKRAGSSFKSASRTRPRPRPRPVRNLSHNSRQPKPKTTNKMPWEDFPWEDAAKVAFQAGGVALMKVGAEQMPWRTKGTKIASAALGAAVVDHVLKPDKRGGVKYAAMRHLAEVAVGNMVVSPAIGKMSGGKKR